MTRGSPELIVCGFGVRQLDLLGILPSSPVRVDVGGTAIGRLSRRAATAKLADLGPQQDRRSGNSMREGRVIVMLCTK